MSESDTSSATDGNQEEEEAQVTAVKWYRRNTKRNIRYVYWVRMALWANKKKIGMAKLGRKRGRKVPNGCNLFHNSSEAFKRFKQRRKSKDSDESGDEKIAKRYATTAMNNKSNL